MVLLPLGNSCRCTQQLGAWDRWEMTHDSIELVSFPDYLLCIKTVWETFHKRAFSSYVIKTIHIHIHVLKFAPPSWSTALYMAVYAVLIENELALQITLI